MELKPCPVCGATKGLYILEDYHEFEWYVFCDNCKTSLCNENAQTKEDAIKHWNTRFMETCRNLSEWHDVDEFICSKCGIILNGYAEVYYNEDDSTGLYEFACEYCPNCGAKVVE